VHDVWPLEEYDPSAHAWQLVAADGDEAEVPGAHGSHVVLLAVADKKLPGSQYEHEVWPLRIVYAPVGHVLHTHGSVAPMAADAFPNGHHVQSSGWVTAS
jgi:hypothetical protein